MYRDTEFLLLLAKWQGYGFDYETARSFAIREYLDKGKERNTLASISTEDDPDKPIDYGLPYGIHK